MIGTHKLSIPIWLIESAIKGEKVIIYHPLGMFKLEYLGEPESVLNQKVGPIFTNEYHYEVTNKHE